MSLAIVSRPVVTSTVRGDVGTDSWVVDVTVTLLAKWDGGDGTITRTYQLITRRAIPEFSEENPLATWPINESEGGQING